MKPNFCFSLLTLFLTACQTSLITDLTVPSDRTLYKDDFSDISSGWPRAVSANSSEDYVDGSYRIEINIPQYDMWAIPGQDYSDVRVEVDATRLSGPDANRFGLICRYRNPQNYYFYIISSDGYYTIGKILNGTSHLLGQEMMVFNTAIIQGDGPNHLRFDCIGNTLTGYVNGKAVASARDTDFSSGDAGILAGSFNTAGVQVVFNNFVVTKP